MKILFIGCVEGSAILLNHLIFNGKNICGVVTKSASRINSDFVSLAPICEAHHIPYQYYSKDSEEETTRFIQTQSPDIIYCFGWSHLLPGDMIRIPPLGVVGFHPAELPQNRGRHPLIWALVLGLPETASSFFMITEGVDDGVVISQERIPITDTDTARTLMDHVMETAKKQVIDFTNVFECGQQPVCTTVDHSKPTNLWRKRSKKDGIIDFRMSAKNIYNLVRALTHPYPGASFYYADQEYTVWSCQPVIPSDDSYRNLEPGKVIQVYSPKSFLVVTGEHLLKIQDCTPPISLSAGDYLC